MGKYKTRRNLHKRKKHKSKRKIKKTKKTFRKYKKRSKKIRKSGGASVSTTSIPGNIIPRPSVRAAAEAQQQIRAKNVANLGDTQRTVINDPVGQKLADALDNKKCLDKATFWRELSKADFQAKIRKADRDIETARAEFTDKLKATHAQGGITI